MPVQVRLLKDDASFTTTTELISLFPDRYVHKLTIGLKGEMTAAASVAPATVINTIDTFKVFLGGSSIIDLLGSEIWVLNNLVFGKNPITIAASAATDSHTKIMGLDVPIYQPGRPLGQLTCQVGFTRQSGVDTETLTLAEYSYDVVKVPTYFHAVRILGTTAATTGYGNRTELPQPGDLHGLLFFSTTIPTDASQASTVQKAKIYADGREIIESSWHEMRAGSVAGGNSATWASPGDATLIDNFAFLNLADDPIPKAASVVVDVYGGVANEAYRIIPIYYVAP